MSLYFDKLLLQFIKRSKNVTTYNSRSIGRSLVLAWQRTKKTKPRPKKVSRLDILKDKLTGIIRDYRYE